MSRGRAQVGTTFEGFGPGLVALYDGLAADNSRAYWLAHKDVYESEVRGPLEALAADLAPLFGEAKLFRPNRDVRFSPDKRPYQEHASLAVMSSTGAALYLQIGPEDLLLAAGLWAPSPEQLRRFRRAVDAGAPAVELDRALATARRRAGLVLGEGDPVKTAPRGYPRDHSRIDLLRRRSLTVSRAWEPAAWWWSGELRDVVVDTWRAAGPFNDWCERHAGPPDRPDDRAPRGR